MLATIIKKSHDSRVVPEDWKTAIITPVSRKERDLMQQTTDQYH